MSRYYSYWLTTLRSYRIPHTLTCLISVSLGHSTHHTGHETFHRLHHSIVTSQSTLFLSCFLECNLPPSFQHFILALHRFECSLFRLGKDITDTTALAPLIGLDVRKNHSEDSSAVVTVHPRATSVSSKRDYSKLCSILCAYRTFEVLALDSEISVLQRPTRLLPPLSLPKFDRDSERLLVSPFIYVIFVSSSYSC